MGLARGSANLGTNTLPARARPINGARRWELRDSLYMAGATAWVFALRIVALYLVGVIKMKAMGKFERMHKTKDFGRSIWFPDTQAKVGSDPRVSVLSLTIVSKGSGVFLSFFSFFLPNPSARLLPFAFSIMSWNGIGQFAQT